MPDKYYLTGHLYDEINPNLIRDREHVYFNAAVILCHLHIYVVFVV